MCRIYSLECCGIVQIGYRKAIGPGRTVFAAMLLDRTGPSTASLNPEVNKSWSFKAGYLELGASALSRSCELGFVHVPTLPVLIGILEMDNLE